MWGPIKWFILFSTIIFFSYQIWTKGSWFPLFIYLWEFSGLYCCDRRTNLINYLSLVMIATLIYFRTRRWGLPGLRCFLLFFSLKKKKERGKESKEQAVFEKWQTSANALKVNNTLDQQRGVHVAFINDSTLFGFYFLFVFKKTLRKSRFRLWLLFPFKERRLHKSSYILIYSKWISYIKAHK